MEDPSTPWFVAEATAAPGVSVLWVWLPLLAGVAVVLLGGMALCVG